MCVLIFFYKLSETFLVLRRIQPVNLQIPDFMTMCPLAAESFHEDRPTGRNQQSPFGILQTRITTCTFRTEFWTARGQMVYSVKTEAEEGTRVLKTGNTTFIM
jgi:hypothetical protein